MTCQLQLLLFALILLSNVCSCHSQPSGTYREERKQPFKRKSHPKSAPNNTIERVNLLNDKSDNLYDGPVRFINVSDDYPCAIQSRNRTDGAYYGTRNYRIVVTTTATYFPIFLNWLFKYYYFCPNTDFIFFVCFDKVVEKRIQDYHLSCNYTHYLPTTGAHQRIWLIRSMVVRKLISAGYDVLLADSDATWVRNPFPILSQFYGSDIIASRASYPEDIFERQGATICMGFVYFQSNLGTVSLWKDINDEMMKHRQPDDQRIFNHALIKLGLQFTRKLNYQTNKVHDFGTIQTKFYNYNITMLSHALFRRVCDVTQKEATRAAVVAHCSISGKDLSMKQLAVQNFGFWYLKRNWESIPVHNLTMSDMLQTIAKSYSVFNNSSLS